MSSSVGKDLKRSVGDQLRGVRYLVRMLGSDAQRPNLAPPALPDVLPEFDRLLGKSFRAVDSVMSAVETTVRPSTGAFRGFLQLKDYTDQQADALQEDIYNGLKAVAAIARSNQLILKSRVAGIQADMAGRRAMSEPREECAEFLVVLVRRNPLVDVREDAGTPLVLKQYVALALLFGLATKGRLPEAEALSLAEDALLLASTRLDTIAGHLKMENSREPLAATLAVLLGHLA